MTNEQIKEKFGIEPIMKEGWCWNDDKGEAEKCLCLYKDSLGDYNFYCLTGPIRDEGYFKNFSEKDPNIIEPKVGDWGWFWDNETERSAIYGELLEINKDKRLIYKSERGFKINFSHEKPDFLK